MLPLTRRNNIDKTSIVGNITLTRHLQLNMFPQILVSFFPAKLFKHTDMLHTYRLNIAKPIYIYIYMYDQ